MKKTMNKVFELGIEEKCKIFTDKIKFIKANEKVRLIEQNKDVDMIIEVELSRDAVFIEKLEEEINIFSCGKCADYIILEFLEKGEFNIHILELKQTITKKSWKNIKEQFWGAYLRMFSIIPFYFEEIKNMHSILFYTIYVNDKLSKDIILDRYNLYNIESEYLDWIKSKNIEIGLITKEKFKHKKINVENGKKINKYRI